MLEEYLPLFMFAALFGLILAGFPVAFTLGGTGLIFAGIGHALGLFSLSDFGFIPSKIFGVIANFTLIAVPLFIFMGVALERSGIAEELLTSMEYLFRGIRGGLALALVLVGALLAASTGIVGATVVTMGVLSLPTLIERNYNKELACGTIAASGTLGQIIPPSIVLVLLGDIMNIAVADLFAGAMLPGLLLVVLYSTYIVVRAALNPSLAPAAPPREDGLSRKEIALVIIKSLVPPTILILLVLGSILFGIASPTESAACGAVGALAIALFRKRFTREMLRSAMAKTTSMTTMVFTLLIGAQIFSVVFRGLYGDDLIAGMIAGLNLPRSVVLFIVMAIIFFLGFFIDFIEICFIVVPIVTPLLTLKLGFDPLWVAILIAVNLQTSFLTPPFGFALFYLKGVCPPSVTTAHIYRGIVPFVVLQLVGLMIVALFPQLVTWLPRMMFGEG